MVVTTKEQQMIRLAPNPDCYRDSARTELFEEFIADKNGVLTEALHEQPLHDSAIKLGKLLANAALDPDMRTLAIAQWITEVEREASVYADEHETERARSMADV